MAFFYVTPFFIVIDLHIMTFLHTQKKKGTSTYFCLLTFYFTSYTINKIDFHSAVDPAPKFLGHAYFARQVNSSHNEINL